jgi:hypothetical protein
MSDEEKWEEWEDRQIADARERDERAARLLGDYTPVEEMLASADERAALWQDIVDFLGRVSESGPDHLATPARALLDRVRGLWQ